MSVFGPSKHHQCQEISPLSDDLVRNADSANHQTDSPTSRTRCAFFSLRAWLLLHDVPIQKFGCNRHNNGCYNANQFNKIFLEMLSKLFAH